MKTILQSFKVYLIFSIILGIIYPLAVTFFAQVSIPEKANGSLILKDDCTGFYCEDFPSKLPENLKYNPRVCIMAVNADKVFWGRALVEGKFPSAPGVRLYGTAGEAREGTREEIEMWQKRVSFARALKGYKIMWENMHVVRDIKFDSFEPVGLREMTVGLW